MNARTRFVRPISPETLNRILPGLASPAARGYHAIYREHAINHCPGCGRTHWHVGRVTAECAFCATALPLEASLSRSAFRPVITHRNMGRAA